MKFYWMYSGKTWCTMHLRRTTVLYEKDVIYDSDCLVCFLAVGQCGILKKLFSRFRSICLIGLNIIKKLKKGKFDFPIF